MPVQKWELWSVTVMLISTHGDEAEEIARKNYEDAEEEGHLGNIVVWEEIQKLLPKVRAAKTQGDQPEN